MIVKDIPKDITKYESKFVGPLTLRQVLCTIPVLVLGISIYFSTRSVIGEMAIPLALLASTPFILIGFVKIYNLPFEKFVHAIFKSVFLAPTHRKFKTENSWEILEKEIDKEEEQERKNKKGKETDEEGEKI